MKVKEEIRDKTVEITTAGSNIPAFSVPKNMIGYLHKIEVNNKNANDANVRIHDDFTTEDGTDYSKKKFDMTVAANDSVQIEQRNAKRVIGDVTVISDQGSADSPVVTNISTEFR